MRSASNHVHPHRSLATKLLGVALLILFSGHVPCALAADMPRQRLKQLDLPEASFRITFGLEDDQPRLWSGRVIPVSGQQLVVEQDHFFSDPSQNVLGESAPQIKEYPYDYLRDEQSWECMSRIAPSGLPADEWVNRSEQDPETIMRRPSILVHVRAGAGYPVAIETKQGAFRFVPADLPVGGSEEFLDGAVRVERIPTIGPVSSSISHQDFPAICTRDNEVWVAWQEFNGDSDAVCVRRLTAKGTWSPISCLVKKADVFRVCLAEDGEGGLWAIWAMQADHNWDLYGRRYAAGTWSSLERLTSHKSPDCFHRVACDANNRLWITWQRSVSGTAQIMAMRREAGRWTDPETVSAGVSAKGNNWAPAIAAGEDGTVAVAWDGYASRSYDVYLRTWRDGAWEEVRPVAATPRFEAHPTVAVDAQGRVWVAWDESEPEWGKDTGFLVTKSGTQVYQSRRVRLACLDADRWLETESSLNQAFADGGRWELPMVKLDHHGRPMVFARRVRAASPDTPSYAPLYGYLWEMHVSRYDGESWSRPIVFPHSAGRLEVFPSIALNDDQGMWVSWMTDRRATNSWNEVQSKVYLGKLPGRASSGELALKSHAPEPVEEFTRVEPSEAADVERVRSYRLDHKGKTYRIFRGDLHRHSDTSVDGGHDGSLVDAYRYARDGAALDFVAVTDHNDNVDREYAWWRNQKMADVFQLDNFVAFYAYERSIAYPNGHRNIFHTERGHVVHPITASEQRGWEGAKALYTHLHQAGGFCISHTTGRWSGTDWRSGDPSVEPLVEIYQGMRDTYEYVGAPKPKRLWEDFIDLNKPVPRAAAHPGTSSFRPQGFVRKALDKGHKLGFIASSDHISTHISYACLIAEKLTLEDLDKAVRARRTYAATDNIVLDVRYKASGGEHLMGEIFESDAPLRLRVKVLGTAPIRQIDVIKDGEIVHTLQPDDVQVDFEFTDKGMSPGESYLYVRVIQTDGDMAWGSPAWVRYSRQ